MLYACILIFLILQIEETKKKWAQAAPIEKNFYIEDPDVKMMLTSEVEAYRFAVIYDP